MTFDSSIARRDLPSVTAAVYLNAGSFGPLPRVAAEAMRAHVDASLEQGRIGGAGFTRMIAQFDRARDAFAGALGEDPTDVALMHCTTDGVNAVVWGLPLGRGDEVVTTTHEHPGLTAPLDELARVRGVEVRAVAPERLADAIGPRTKLVAFSHVLWTHGETLDVSSIAAEARSRGALVLVDGAQSVGAIPVRPSQLGADFYTVSGQKWLCGPSGTGALWIRGAVLSQLGTPWPWYLSKARGPDGTKDWPGARRLDATTLSMTSLDGVIAALRWHAEQVGRGALDAALARANELRRRLGEVSGVSVLPTRTPSLLVSFRVEGEGAGAVADRLESARVLVRSIPGSSAAPECVRAAIGFWNDEQDMDTFLHALRR